MNIQNLMPSAKGTFARCAVCGFEGHSLLKHVEKHDLTISSYVEKYPKSATVSEWAYSEFKTTQADVVRTPPGDFVEVTTKLGQVIFDVNTDVPEEACLPLPVHYNLPRSGELGRNVEDALIALKLGRSLYISGVPGTGKDALVHAFSASTRKPAICFNIRPDADIQAWVSSQGFTENRTYYAEGALLKAARDGYLTPGGRRVPYVILLSDFDRSSKDQAEILRSMLEDNPRLLDLEGNVHKILPGTQFVATANTQGGGDYTGRLISANPIDSSLLNRFERKIIFSAMHWKDEEKIVRLKFPDLFEKDPKAIRAIGKATEAIRAAIINDDLYGEFSHRDVCSWCKACIDLMNVLGTESVDLLRAARMSFVGGFPDPTNRAKVIKCLDPFIAGGAIRSARSESTGQSLPGNL